MSNSKLPRVWKKSTDASVSIGVAKNNNGEYYIVENSAAPSALVTHRIEIDPNTFIASMVPLNKEVVNKDNFVNESLRKEFTKMNNVITRDKYSTYVKITNFSELPMFWIDTPTFKFNSHNNGNGWELRIKQRWYGSYVGKTSVCLTKANSHPGDHGIRIRLRGDSAKIRIQSIEDVISMFEGEFELVHSYTLTMSLPKTPITDISSYSDEELLQEVHKRTMARLGDYRGATDTKVDYSNVIDLDSVRRIVFDDSAVMRLLNDEAA